MPQFDVFLFFSSIFYLLIGFFLIMSYNQFIFLPRLAAILKLRQKLSLSQSSGNSNIVKSSKKLIRLSKTL